MECTKVNCPMQAGTPTDNCGENCPWRTTAKTGDLISRAVLLRDLSYCAPELWQDEEYIKAKIMKQHAVDAVPVVHGRWVYEHSDPVLLPCSVCGYQVYRYNNTHYCPNCGAKMDGETQLPTGCCFPSPRRRITMAILEWIDSHGCIFFGLWIGLLVGRWLREL